MYKIKGFREVAFASIPVLLLTGCSRHDLEKTEIKDDYHSIFVDENGETLSSLKITDLRTVGIYVVFEDSEVGPIYSTKYLQYHEYKDYSVYVDAMSGEIYSYSINNPTTYDQIYYSHNGHKDMYFVENLANEIYDYKGCGYITSDNINLEEDTVDPFTVKLMYADYIPHNQYPVISSYNTYIRK